MRKMLGTLAAAGLVALGLSAPVAAQEFSVRIGTPSYGQRHVVREVYERPAYRHRVVERRYIQRPARTRTVCRTVIRERVRANGVIVRRPVEQCRQTVASRRFYAD